MVTQNQNQKFPTEKEVFLDTILKETDLKNTLTLEHYIRVLRICAEGQDPEYCNTDKHYADLLESIALFLLDLKRDYDLDKHSAIKSPEEIDKNVDRVLIFLLRGLTKVGYAPDEDVIQLMKEYIKRHES